MRCDVKKKFLSAVFAGLMALNIFGGVDNAQAASRDEIAAIKVKCPSDFKYWTKNSQVNKEIVDYVKDVTNKRSKNFIPVEDRIAVFDMDGTILYESNPGSIDWFFPIYTVFENPTDNVNTELRTRTQIWLDAVQNKNITDEITADRRKIVGELFAGITMNEYIPRIKKFMNKNIEGFSNLKYGEAFYLPMIEIISYLNANDFTVYVVSGSERNLARTLLDGAVKVQTNHVIGGDVTFKRESSSGEKYYTAGDKIVFGDERRKNNTNMNKIFSINREIGKKPVLAFGNSMGDADMLNYTLADNKYKSAAFVVICDDYTREIGNKDLENTMLKAAQKNGWSTISMKNDFKTIYGDKVKKS